MTSLKLLVAALRRPRCPICLDRIRRGSAALKAHLYVQHGDG